MPTVEISTDPARLDVTAIHAFLTTSAWAAGIPRATVERAIAHSVCVGAYADGAQVGFARVVTDRATFAYLCDVYVLEAHRGAGVARRLLRALLDRPELQGLRRLVLVTRDAHPVYRPFGFTPLASPERYMERHHPEVYAARAPGPT